MSTIMVKPLLNKNQKQRLYTVDLLMKVSKELPVTTPLGKTFANKANKQWIKFLRTK